MVQRTGNRKVREATWSGIFYPDDPALLSAKIDALLDKARARIRLDASAIVSPHASLDYSGDLAALAWANASGRKPSRIVIIGPSHRATESLLWLPEADSFQGPFGAIPVDRKGVAELMDCGTYNVLSDVPHLEEHSIEIQLPFVARLFPTVPIVPILTGKVSLPLVKSLANSLRIVYGRKAGSTLIAVSSDLEFASTPVECNSRSDRLLEFIQEARWEGLVAEALAGRLTSCGIAAIAALQASGLAGKPEVLGRHDLGAAREREDDAYGEYAAIAFG